MALAETIRDARMKQGLSKNAAAELVGISATYWDKIEKALSVPTVDVAARIKKVLDLPAEAFFESVADEALTSNELDAAVEENAQHLSAKVGATINVESLVDFGKKLAHRQKRDFLQALRKAIEENTEEEVARPMKSKREHKKSKRA